MRMRSATLISAYYIPVRIIALKFEIFWTPNPWQTLFSMTGFFRQTKISRGPASFIFPAIIGIGEGLTTFTLPHHQGIRVRTRRFM